MSDTRHRWHHAVSGWDYRNWSAEGRKNWCQRGAMNMPTTLIGEDIYIHYMTRYVRHFRWKAKIKTRRKR